MKFVFGVLTLVISVVVVILLITSIMKGIDGQQSVQGASASLVYDLLSKEAEENYRWVRYTITPSSRTVEQFKGYKGALEKSQSLSNTPESYKAFLAALTTARFAHSKSVTSQIETACVQGSRYVYEFLVSGAKKIDTWATTCSSKNAPFAGDPQGVNQLVKAQFPALSDIPSAYSL
jgi:hypothetical protein